MVCRMNCWFVTSHGLRVIKRNDVLCGCGTWSLTGREERTKNTRKRGAEEYVRGGKGMADGENCIMREGFMICTHLILLG